MIDISTWDWQKISIAYGVIVPSLHGVIAFFSWYKKRKPNLRVRLGFAGNLGSIEDTYCVLTIVNNGEKPATVHFRSLGYCRDARDYIFKNWREYKHEGGIFDIKETDIYFSNGAKDFPIELSHN